ncbi:ACP S-malonyltransferase [Cellulomonas soli]|uniref:[acyl-carrier-protein] S-malonyltransferase n=1 Tax=Cellulomonas soli TaxID=931535 RepID=A0A512PDI5_9CELL|nr:ACP S-malonyltransferase [Cellulomonas soli]NYI60083.1 malonyl CoA-acyl carrier protein transacylase [Cellulomonas soli]GEP69263.1 malonyl CoA-acyl carrier protein transacylase [Cellulomonas soli]
MHPQTTLPGPGTLWVFPGQSSQAVGMGREAVRRSPRAAAFVTEAGDAIGQDLRALCWDADIAELTRTENVQPALTAVALATWIALDELGLARRGDADLFAGHSLGALAAAAAAGYLDLVDAVRLALERGRIMASAPTGGSMLEVRTAHENDPAAQLAHGTTLADRFGLDLAAVNGPTEIALAGAASRIESAARELGEAARAVPVSNAFHSRFMTPVVPRWVAALDAVGLRQGSARHVGCATAQVSGTADGVRDDLVLAVDGPVRWLDVLDLTREVPSVAVVGPSRVMRRLLQPCLGARPLRVYDEHAWSGPDA